MIWKIVKEGFLLNLTTFKFSLGTLPCIVLSGGIRARLCRWLSAEAGRTNELSGIQQGKSNDYLLPARRPGAGYV